MDDDLHETGGVQRDASFLVVPTKAEVDAAQARIDARHQMLAELNRLTAARDRAELDATIALRVAVDMECAAGLRRKTRTGRHVGPRPPREALRRIEQALTDWYAAAAAQQAAVDAHIAKLGEAFPIEQYRADLDLVDRWLRAKTAHYGRRI
jgi:hypothetical protein